MSQSSSHKINSNNARLLPGECFAVIDFEASSLDENSFPIEVGVAEFCDGAIDSWSSLIQPTAEWMRRDAWSARSERVHGISRDLLASAPSAKDVLTELNERLGDCFFLYSDNAEYDRRWLAELAKAARLRATFCCVDIHARIDRDPAVRERFTAFLAANPAPHRAEPDAIRLVRAFLAASRPQGGE